MKKILKIILLGFLIFLLISVSYFFIGEPPRAEEITWGVNFSQKHARDLGLDWKETYLALLDDLGIRNIKLITHWDLIEPEKDKYSFEDLDWKISEAEKRGAKILLVIGMKTGRWPECHEPNWVRNQKSKIKNQKSLLEYIEKIVNRYKNNETIWAWQVENEPFFPFGECPWMTDKKFLKEEIKLVKSLDNKKRPIVISDSGEVSFWIRTALLGDIVGITIYRKVWFTELRTYLHHFVPPIFYWRKAQIINKFFNKEVICVELQAEPWGPKLLYDSPLAEQEKTMNLEQFRYNMEFAKKTGFDTFYLWGGEWWFWLKEKHNQPEIWQEAKKLF